MRHLTTAAVLTLAVALITAAPAARAGATGNSSAAMSDTKPAILPLAEQAGFTTLVKAVKAAGLEDALTTGGPFTVFAPTDEAFAKLPDGTLQGLLEQPEKLKKVLLYHVVSGTVKAADVVKLKSAETLEGQPVAIGTKDGVTIDNAKVLKTDIEARNGVVHVIDTVLIPENL